MGSQSFSQSMFTDLCERMLRLCKLRPDETFVVLSQGDERAEYVDAFMSAAQRLGARPMNLRLPYSSSASGGEVGVWTVGVDTDPCSVADASVHEQQREVGHLVIGRLGAVRASPVQKVLYQGSGFGHQAPTPLTARGRTQQYVPHPVRRAPGRLEHRLPRLAGQRCEFIGEFLAAGPHHVPCVGCVGGYDRRVVDRSSLRRTTGRVVAAVGPPAALVHPKHVGHLDPADEQRVADGFEDRTDLIVRPVADQSRSAVAVPGQAPGILHS
jgi:hypothetical protein